jgi:biotin carboxyl carrier protein
VALGYFKWRAQPADAKDPIPADVEEGNRERGTGNGERGMGNGEPDVDTAKFAQIGKAFAALMAACGGAKSEELIVKSEELGVAGGNRPEAAAIQAADKSAEPPTGTPVLAPLNGTFYRSAGPGKPEMAKDGDPVKSGAPVCIVEAMKLFNPIKATANGKITFLVEHGKPVTKGQTLAVIA